MLKAIGDAAELITQIKSAFLEIDGLKRAQQSMTAAMESNERRIRELEAALREIKAETKFEAIKETQSMVNAAQGQIYGELRTIFVALDRISRVTDAALDAPVLPASNGVSRK